MDPRPIGLSAFCVEHAEAEQQKADGALNGDRAREEEQAEEAQAEAEAQVECKELPEFNEDWLDPTKWRVTTTSAFVPVAAPLTPGEEKLAMDLSLIHI